MTIFNEFGIFSSFVFGSGNTQVLGENKEKLISQSYDGANVMSGKNAGVQALIWLAGYMYAFFIHCYSHQFNLWLKKATTQNKEVKIFFADLSGITSFF